MGAAATWNDVSTDRRSNREGFLLVQNAITLLPILWPLSNVSGTNLKVGPRKHLFRIGPQAHRRCQIALVAARDISSSPSTGSICGNGDSSAWTREHFQAIEKVELWISQNSF